MLSETGPMTERDRARNRRRVVILCAGFEIQV
jgi:hypothetical protein